jgi:hypothetical protein
MPEQKPRPSPSPLSGFFEKLKEMYSAYRVEAVMRCYTLASRDEQRARLRAVQALSVELAKICEKRIFATAIYGDCMIEAVIEGDWPTVGRIVGDLSFDDFTHDPEALRMYRGLWTPFRAVAKAAFDEALLRGRVEDAEVDAAARATAPLTHKS